MQGHQQGGGYLGRLSRYVNSTRLVKTFKKWNILFRKINTKCQRIGAII